MTIEEINKKYGFKNYTEFGKLIGKNESQSRVLFNWVKTRPEFLEMLAKGAANPTHDLGDSIKDRLKKGCIIDSVKELTEITGRSDQVLWKWRKMYPEMLTALISGAELTKLERLKNG